MKSVALIAAPLVLFSGHGIAGEQDAIDGCIDALRDILGGGGGQVLSSEFSEAATLVMLESSDGSTWRCLAYSDGTVGEILPVGGEDDGEGAMAGAGSEYGGANEEGFTSTQRVQFERGASSAEYNDGLTPGSSMRWVLNARDGQDLRVSVAPYGEGIYYQIFNPDGSFLLEQMTPDNLYQGQLWQSGDHVVEVMNRGNENTSYRINFRIE